MAKGKRKSGRYEKKITINGKAYHIYGKTASELIAKEAAKREEIKRGASKRENPTIRVYCDNWIDGIRDSIKSGTLCSYKSHLSSICNVKLPDIERPFGDIKIRDVTITDLRNVQAILAARNISTTVNSGLSILNRILKEAADERIIDYNPAALLKSIKRTEERARNTYHRALTKEEQKAFFDCDITKNSFYYNVFRLAINTGMRFGEIGALKASDIYDKKIQIT